MVTPNPQFSMSIDTKGLEEAIQAARRLSPNGHFVDVVINDGLREIGRVLVPSKGVGPIAQETPKITGKLARSTFFEILANRLVGFGIREQGLVIRQPAKTPPEYGSAYYGGFVRGGTKPHEIRPRLKKVLHWRKGEQDFFASLVHHPGNKPNRYHQVALSRNRLQIQGIVSRMARRITSQFGKVKGL